MAALDEDPPLLATQAARDAAEALAVAEAVARLAEGTGTLATTLQQVSLQVSDLGTVMNDMRRQGQGGYALRLLLLVLAASTLLTVSVSTIQRIGGYPLWLPLAAICASWLVTIIGAATIYRRYQ